MVVIKTGAAEHSAYISVLPKGLCSFMKAGASHRARSAILTVYRGRTGSWYIEQESIFLPVCRIELIILSAMTAIKFDVSLQLRDKLWKNPSSLCFDYDPLNMLMSICHLTVYFTDLAVPDKKKKGMK